ncbi:IPT/TIG domain-containing protein, partial [bacterium]
IAGCEYDGPTAVYDRPYEKADPPVITSIDPAEAVAGVNFVTIHGNNFSSSMDNNKVYVDGSPSEIVESSSSILKIRRPSQSGDATTIKVLNYEVSEYATYTPYKIDPVEFVYSGGFLDGSQMGAIAVDADENLYFFIYTTRLVYKIAQNGDQTFIGTTSRMVKEVKVVADGTLLIFASNTTVYKMDPVTGEDTEWYKFKKKTSSGDFDANGNLYTGGGKSDLLILSPDMTETASEVFNSRSDNIFCVRVFNNHVYVLATLGDFDENNPEVAIWRMPILDAAGTLGERELVLDWATTGEYASSEPLYFTIAQDGMMLVGTDHVNPILTLDLGTNVQDVLYKDILSTSANYMTWGNGNYLYMIQGGDTWRIRRIDTGKPGAPYFGM